MFGSSIDITVTAITIPQRANVHFDGCTREVFRLIVSRIALVFLLRELQVDDKRHRAVVMSADKRGVLTVNF